MMIEKTIEMATAGLRAHTIGTDRFKMSRLSFNFILPADRERSPLTRLMLAVMMRGCRKYPSVISINKRLDELYGATVTWRATAIGRQHVFRISCEMLSNQYRLRGDTESIVGSVCDLLLDILLDPLRDENGLLSRANFESEKKLAIDAIRAKINDQKSYAAEQCRELMFEGSPSGISVEGTEEQIEAFTLEQVSENIEYFLRNAALECYYVGNDDVEQVIELIGRRFAGLGRERCYLTASDEALVRPADSEIREKSEKMEVSQSRLNIGYTCDTVMRDVDYYPMCLFNEIFGGSSVAKLFMNLREKRSLCYYCYSSYHSATGAIMVGCGIKEKNRQKAFVEIQKQLRNMQKGKFSDAELESAKQTVISGLRQISDSPSAMEAFRFRRILAGVCETEDESIQRIRDVTRKEIAEAAKKVRLDTVYFLAGAGGGEECENE